MHDSEAGSEAVTAGNAADESRQTRQSPVAHMNADTNAERPLDADAGGFAVRNLVRLYSHRADGGRRKQMEVIPLLSCTS